MCQILAFSRQQPTERQPVDVSLVISESCCLLRASPASKVELVCPADLRPHFTFADATQLGQVLLNLGTNAVQPSARAAVAWHFSSTRCPKAINASHRA